MAHMLRCLFYLEAKFDMCLTAVHVPGVENKVADAVSRNKLDAFFSSPSSGCPSTAVVPAGSCGGVGGAEKLEYQRLDKLVGEFIDASIAPSTKRVYASGQRRYLSFCVSIGALPLPLAEAQLCRFVARLAGEGLKHATIKGYLSALRRMQIVWGAGDPFVASWPRLECTLKGVKLKQARSAATRPRERLPVTPAILRMLRGVWGADGKKRDNIMLWAACCMCFFGFLRSGEVTVASRSRYDPEAHLSEGDVRLGAGSPPQMVQVHLKSSKTDPFRRGVTVCLGRTGNILCPVNAIAAYLVARGREAGPFFTFSSGAPLSRESLVRWVRAALGAAGMDATKYSGHSFRIGAATTAALVGIEDSLIKTLGRWESAAYLLYVRVPREKLTAVAGKMAVA